MAINTNLDPRNARGWEIDPSTRESLRLYTKDVPIDSTLGSAGTAEDLISVSPGFETVNLITNPSMETGDPPTGYSAVRSATISQDSSEHKYGSNSLKAVPPNSERGEGASFSLESVPYNVPLALSAYFKAGSASGDARVELVAHSIDGQSYSDVRVAVGSTVSLSTSWQRSELLSNDERFIYVFKMSSVTGTFQEDETITGGDSSETATVSTVASTYLVVRSPSGQFKPEQFMGETETITGGSSSATATLDKVEKVRVTGTIYVYFVTVTKHGTTFYVDGVQAEIRDMVTTYCDGAQGKYNSWDGTANASTSRRKKGLSEIRSYALHTNKDVYIAHDIDAANSGDAEDKGQLVKAGSDFGASHLHLESKISFINANSGETPRVYGVVWGV